VEDLKKPRSELGSHNYDSDEKKNKKIKKTKKQNKTKQTNKKNNIISFPRFLRRSQI